jgi:hypothetical protein
VKNMKIQDFITAQEYSNPEWNRVDEKFVICEMEGVPGGVVKPILSDTPIEKAWGMTIMGSAFVDKAHMVIAGGYAHVVENDTDEIIASFMLDPMVCFLRYVEKYGKDPDCLKPC